MLLKQTAGANESMPSVDSRLAGARVLILEDETLVSMMIEDMLTDLGCKVVGPYARLDQAMEAVTAGEAVDAALLDVNLGRTQSFPLAEMLKARDVPFVFTTGYDDSGIPTEWRDRPALRKPFMMHHMKEALEKALV